MLLTQTEAQDIPSTISLGFLDAAGDGADGFDAADGLGARLSDETWAVGEDFAPPARPAAPGADAADDLGARLSDELTFDAPASFSATAGEFTPDDGLTFDAPASFSAAASEFRPSSGELQSKSDLRADSGEFRPGGRAFPAAPAEPHALAAFFLPADQESRSLAVLDCARDAARVVEAASTLGVVAGVDDSFSQRGVVFLQFDDVRVCTTARENLADRLGFPTFCEAVVFGPAARGVSIRGLPAHTSTEDVRAVFATNGYGDVAAIRKWLDDADDRSGFAVQFYARSDAERAAQELAGSRGVSVEFLPLDRDLEARDADLRDALDALGPPAPEPDPWAGTPLARPAGRYGADRAWAGRDRSLRPDAAEFRGFDEGEPPPPDGLRRSASDWTAYGFGGAPRPLLPLGGARPRGDALGRGRRAGSISASPPGPRDPIDYQFDSGKARKGEDARTTLMVRNIPNKYTQRAVLEEIDVKFRKTYDFFYLPIDFKNKCNVGYAFINLCSSKDALALFDEFHGRRWTCFRSGKVCAITYARIQGKAAMIQRFQNSSLLAESLEVQPRLFVSSGPDKGLPEQFPGGAALPTGSKVPAGAATVAAAAASKRSGGRRDRNRRRDRGGGGGDKAPPPWREAGGPPPPGSPPRSASAPLPAAPPPLNIDLFG